VASVFKRKGDKRRPGAPWYYTFKDADGRRRTRKGCPDKVATERIAAKAENDAALRRQGVIDARADGYAAHERRPIAEHLSDWEAAIVAKGSSAAHALRSRKRTAKVFERAGVVRLSEMTPSRVMAALADLASLADWSIESRNHHVRAVKGFARWAWRDGRTRDHALLALGTLNPERDRRRVRRPLTPDECLRLIAATLGGPVVKGMSGRDRVMAYAVALGTGLRRNELRSLTPESFDLDAESPSVTVEAAYAKNKRQAVQPIPPALVESLARYLADKAPGRPVFALPDRTAEMLRVDLVAAGIEYQTPAGVVDFHASRHTYVSHVVASGASVKAAQTLARHSSPALTIGVYARASLHDLAGAVAKLPALGTPGDDPEAAALPMTGTDGPRRAAHAQRAGGGSCRIHAAPDISAGARMSGDARHKCLAASDVDASVRPEPASVVSTPGRIRTCDRGIRNPMPPIGKGRILNILRLAAPERAAPAQRAAQPEAPTTPPDLAAVMAAWHDLPAAVRAGVVALVRAASSSPGNTGG
jgi:integrase